jgi:hypothetical protein
MTDDEQNFTVDEWIPKLEDALLNWHQHDDLRVKSPKLIDSQRLVGSVLGLKTVLLSGGQNNVCILSPQGVSLLSPPMYEKLMRFLRAHPDEGIEDVSEVQGTVCSEYYSTQNACLYFWSD